MAFYGKVLLVKQQPVVHVVQQPQVVHVVQQPQVIHVQQPYAPTFIGQYGMQPAVPRTRNGGVFIATSVPNSSTYYNRAPSVTPKGPYKIVDTRSGVEYHYQ